VSGNPACHVSNKPPICLTDRSGALYNGSGYIAHHIPQFARDLGPEPRTTPVESPQSNDMAEAFVRTIKRDYVRVSPVPDA
jgi:transposase InsO family protein